MSWFRHTSEEKVLVRKIDEVISRTRDEPDAAYTLDRLRTLTDAHSTAALTLAINELVQAGRLRSIVRVESPSNKGGIADFTSTNELPDFIDDWRTGERIKVTPSNVRVLFAAARELHECR